MTSEPNGQHSGQNESEQPNQEHQQETLIDFLTKLDRLDGPVGAILRVWAKRLEGGPQHSFKHGLLICTLILIILLGLVFLVWFNKIDSNALMLLVGLVLGILSNYIRYIFPVGE